jgi:putative ABC transport system permease protein
MKGRDFDDRDTATSPKVAIVDQEFARKYFGGDAIGKTFQLDNYATEARPEYEIVGVVKNSKYYDLRDADHAIGYFPQMQDPHPNQFMDVMIRSTAPLSSLTGAVKQAFAEINPMISIDFHVFQTQIRDGLLRERLMATLSGFFGLLAGILATIGLYGVISYMVARRTSEIGIRMALGATPGRVLALVMREAALLLAIGLTAGAVLTALAARTTQSLLFGLKPYDPVTLGAAVAALALVAAAASLVPARRAAGLEPMQALREE